MRRIGRAAAVAWVQAMLFARSRTHATCCPTCVQATVPAVSVKQCARSKVTISWNVQVVVAVGEIAVTGPTPLTVIVDWRPELVAAASVSVIEYAVDAPADVAVMPTSSAVCAALKVTRPSLGEIVSVEPGVFPVSVAIVAPAT